MVHESGENLTIQTEHTPATLSARSSRHRQVTSTAHQTGNWIQQPVFGKREASGDHAYPIIDLFAA